MIGSDAGLRSRAQSAAEFDPGQAWQHPVQHNEIGRLFPQPGVGFVAARNSFDVVAFRLKIVAKQQRERFFVFDDQNARAHPALRHDACMLANAVVSPFGR